MKTKLATLLATWFGCGRVPVAPGTAGSLAAVAIAAPLALWAGWPPWAFAALAAAITPLAMWSAGVAARAAGIEDPRFVVIDEVAGQWVALAGVHVWSWHAALAAFLLFRLFDIFKPPPVRQLEALPGGVGIVADDLAAGVYAALVLFLAGCFNLY